MAELSQRALGIVESGSDGWEVHYRARRMKAEGKPVTMLSVGDHDIKTDRVILDAMWDSAIGGNLGYASVQGSTALRQAIADRVSSRSSVPATADNIIVTCGGQGALFAAMMTVLNPGDGCIILDPYYANFGITVRSTSAVPVVVPTPAEDGFQPDPGLIEAAVTPGTRAILINSPSNPTGAVYARDRVEAIADLCQRHDLWLISDELYDGQVYDGVHVSPRDLPGMVERTIVIGSMSKGYAMTGARIGWAVAPVGVIEKMADLAGATTYGLPGFIQDAALFALRECSAQEDEVAQRYRRRRDIAVAAVGNGPGAKVVSPQGGMYVMLDIRETGLSGIDFAEQLLDHEMIGVMPGESFGKAASGHVRVALTVADEELADALKRVAMFARGLVK